MKKAFIIFSFLFIFLSLNCGIDFLKFKQDLSKIEKDYETSSRLAEIVLNQSFVIMENQLKLVQDEKQRNVLHYLASYGADDLCKGFILRLSELGFGEVLSAVLNECSFCGNTPLHYASLNGHYDFVALLLSYDACPVILNYNDQTPRCYMRAQRPCCCKNNELCINHKKIDALLEFAEFKTKLIDLLKYFESIGSSDKADEIKILLNGWKLNSFLVCQSQNEVFYKEDIYIFIKNLFPFLEKRCQQKKFSTRGCGACEVCKKIIRLRYMAERFHDEICKKN